MVWYGMVWYRTVWQKDEMRCSPKNACQCADIDNRVIIDG